MGEFIFNIIVLGLLIFLFCGTTKLFVISYTINNFTFKILSVIFYIFEFIALIMLIGGK